MKRLFMLAVTAFLIVAASFTVYAAGWEQKAGGWKWNNGDNTYPSNCWKWIDSNNDGVSECYYFDANGICLQSGTAPDGYTVNADGAWIKDGVVQTKKNNEVVKARIYFNTSKGNTTTSMQSLSKRSGMFAHVDLDAPRWDSKKLKYEIIWPDGQRTNGVWDDNIETGDYATVSFWYEDKDAGPTGTLTIIVYTDAGEKIGEGSVLITE